MLNIPNITPRLVTITPEMAEEYLKKNTANRNVSATNLAMIKRALIHGEWLVNGEAIKISKAGRVLDGQHRLYAIVETGIPMTTYIIEGLDDEAQFTMDTGKARKLADMLTLRGEKSATRLAAIVRRVHLYKEHGLRAASVSSYPLTVAECLAELDRTPRLREMVTDSSRIGRAAKLPGSLVAVLQFAFEEIDEDDSAYFFNKLETGENLSANDPIHVLRGQLDRLDSSHGTVNKTYLMALVIKAWNAFREGREISMLKFRPGGASPEAFPTPK